MQPPVVTGPGGNGTVKVSIDTTGMAIGTYTVTITGRVLTQTISFQVKNPNFGRSVQPLTTPGGTRCMTRAAFPGVDRRASARSRHAP